MLLLYIPALSQDWPTAPEVWSEPVLLDSVFNVPYKWLQSPSLTKNLDTVYLDMGEGIYCYIKLNGKWQDPVKLNSYINPGGVATRYPSISKDGKRLYFSGWGGFGGWDLWYSDWDDSTNDWSIGINMGPVINSESNDLYLYEVSKDTVYVTQSNRHPNLYIIDDFSGDWVKADSFWYHPIGGAEMYGLSLTENKKKMYFGKRRWEDEWAIDLCVTYWDTSENYWGDVFYLNINTKTIPWQNTTKRGGEFYPWISRNGKFMVFCSNRNAPVHPDSADNTTNLFISYMLIDENGDTVTTVDNNISQITNSFSLQQNYPNPFNPKTKIKLVIPNVETGHAPSLQTKLTVFDMLGREVATLINKPLSAGAYEVEFDGSNLSSGVYYYRIRTSDFIKTKKMILLR